MKSPSGRAHAKALSATVTNNAIEEINAIGAYGFNWAGYANAIHADRKTLKEELMIQLIRCTFTSLVFAAVWLVGTAYAQSAQRTIQVHIPFEFNVGETTFPAGDYSVMQPLQNFLALRNARGQTIASTFTHPVESSTAPEKPELRFYFSGGQHNLAEVWQPEDGALGQQLPATKSRMAVAKQPTVDTEAITGGIEP